MQLSLNTARLQLQQQKKWQWQGFVHGICGGRLFSSNIILKNPTTYMELKKKHTEVQTES